MKKITVLTLLLLIISIPLYAMQPFHEQLEKERIVIMSDLDDVFVEPTWWKKPKVVFGGMYKKPLNSLSYLASLYALRKRYERDECQHLFLRDDQGNKISGAAFQFLYHGAKDPHFSPYVPWLINTNEYSRTYVPGMKQLYTYLKERKNIDIILATNKDRIAYNSLETLFGEEFKKIPSKVYVTYPNTAELEQLKSTYLHANNNADYTHFVQYATSLHPTDTIKHIHAQKPDQEYYNTIVNQTQAHKIIFIDDHKGNVESFKSLHQPDKKLVGIHFKSSAQLAQELIEQGILSEKDDQKILETVRYPGISGKARLWANKTYQYLKSFFQK